MRIILFILIFLFLHQVQAQSSYPDSLIQLLEKAPNDSVRFEINRQLSGFYFSLDRKKALDFSEEALKIARINKKMLDVALCLDDKGYHLNKENRYGKAFNCYIEGIRLADDPNNEMLSWSHKVEIDPYKYRMEVLAGLHHDLGHVHRSTGNHTEAMREFRECLNYLHKAFPTSYNSAYLNLGAVYLDMNVLDSALYYERKELEVNPFDYGSVAYKYIGDVHFRKGNMDSAFHYYHKGIRNAVERNKFSQVIMCQMGMAQWHLSMKNKDSSLHYSSRFLAGIKKLKGNPLKDINISNAYELLYRSYSLMGIKDSTLKYLKLAFSARDSITLARIHSLSQYQNLTFSEQLRLEELEKEKLETQSKIRIYALLSGLFIILVIAGVLYRQSRQKQKANRILRIAYAKLQATQSQLIHSEKMASLGELTAGIAHEIQNPLNFVNNFSEVSVDMMNELREEIEQGDKDEVEAITNDLQQNLEKINHHGKRASSIVKGMLEHSRSRSGEKKLTDINTLADEYLRLTYHGLRAKDKSFNADFVADLDDSIPKINVVPQDIGRVLLNLINNAFYACAERSRSTISEASAKETAEKSYKPKVSVTSKKEIDSVMIKVKDNGNGIPKDLLDKIFQPFFTTKPSGKGTGLGLSISYDIVTKGHGGELKVNTKAGVGTEFIIVLPIN